MAAAHPKNTKSKSASVKILDGITVQDIIDEVGREELYQQEYRTPPENYYSHLQLKNLTKLSRSRINSIINEHEDIDRIKIKCIDRVTRLYLNYNDFKKYLYQKPPKGWLTSREISDKYGLCSSYVRQLLFELKRKNIIQPKVFKGSESIRPSNYYNPTEISKALNKIISRKT
jgi:ribosomal protein S25